LCDSLAQSKHYCTLKGKFGSNTGAAGVAGVAGVAGGGAGGGGQAVVVQVLQLLPNQILYRAVV
jgi:hypothetical protein